MAPSSSSSSSLSCCQQHPSPPPLDWHRTEEYLIFLHEKKSVCFLFLKTNNNGTNSDLTPYVSLEGGRGGNPTAMLKAYLRPDDSVPFWTALFAFYRGFFFFPASVYSPFKQWDHHWLFLNSNNSSHNLDRVVITLSWFWSKSRIIWHKQQYIQIRILWSRLLFITL